MKTQVIAHRGAFKAKNLPENSIAALQEAARLACFASEFDVHITQDGTLIVYHDDNLNGLSIAQTNFDELKNFKLSNGEPIPTLENYLIQGKNFPEMHLVLEVKKSNSPEKTREAAQKSVELVQKLSIENQVDYITFHFEAGKLISVLNPHANVAYLEGDKTPQEAKNAGYNGLDYHYSVYKNNPEWIQQAQDLGMTINSWTVNDIEEMKRLINQKANFITTNEPELLLKILQK